MKIYMYNCLICEMMIKLLQWINWLQCKICRKWTLDFENSKIWSTHYEIEINLNLMTRLRTWNNQFHNSHQTISCIILVKLSYSTWFHMQESMIDNEIHLYMMLTTNLLILFCVQIKVRRVKKFQFDAV